MILTCASCSSRYYASDDSIGAGRMVRCAACGYEWLAEPSLVLEKAVEAPQDGGAPARLTRELVERLRGQPRAPAAAQAPTSPAALIRARQAKRERRHRLLQAGAAWGVAAAGVAAVFGAGAAARDGLAQAWPQSATLFEALGLEVNAYGLTIEDVAVDWEQGSDQTVRVHGLVRNLREEPVQAPPLRLVLRDAAGAEAAAVVAHPARAVLAPLGITTFEARFQRPPREAVGLEVLFTRLGAENPPADPQAASDAPA